MVIMVYAKRRSVRRKTIRRKFVRGRKMSTRVSSRYRQGKIYAFKRTCQLKPFRWDSSLLIWTSEGLDSTISSSSTGLNSSGIFKFRLADLPGYNDFLNLYEQYKITGVKLRFVPRIGTESTAPASTATVMAPLAYCIDRGANDQVGGPITFSSLMENQDVRIVSSLRPFNIWIGQVTTHNSADSQVQVAYQRSWLDTQVSNSFIVDHHGLKFSFAETSDANRQVSFSVFATYYVKCRNPQ